MLEHVVECLGVVSYVRDHPSAYCLGEEDTRAFHTCTDCKCQLSFGAGTNSQGRWLYLGLEVGHSYATANILPELLMSGGRVDGMYLVQDRHRVRDTELPAGRTSPSPLCFA